MKAGKTILFSFMIIAFVSCKNDNEKRIDGEFIFTDEAAVLKGDNFIYGVKKDEMAHKLAIQAKGYKKNDLDMVPVIVKAVAEPKPEGTVGWDTIVTIKAIIAVMHPRKDRQGAEVEYKKIEE
ncbi:MAG: hypothetical protein V7767_06315 [Leeuwenhoekiella sp.]